MMWNWSASANGNIRCQRVGCYRCHRTTENTRDRTRGLCRRRIQWRLAWNVLPELCKQTQRQNLRNTQNYVWQIFIKKEMKGIKYPMSCFSKEWIWDYRLHAFLMCWFNSISHASSSNTFIYIEWLYTFDEQLICRGRLLQQCICFKCNSSYFCTKLHYITMYIRSK